MFECQLCKQNGIKIERENLVPHIKKRHPEINGDTKKYMEMFPGLKLRVPPSTSYANKEHMEKCVKKSVESRIGKSLSEEHKNKIGNGVRISEKYKKGRKTLSEQYKTGEKINCRKIIIPETDLRTDYFKSNMSLNEISEKYLTDRHIITRLFKKYDIKQRSRSESVFLACNNRVENRPLSIMEKNIIYGEILGDGCLSTQHGITPFYRHSCKYYDYLFWLKSILPNIYWIDPDITAYTNKKTNKTYFSINSKIHSDFQSIYEDFYEIRGDRKKKRIPPNIILDNTILLHWFLGDGTSNKYTDKNGKICRNVSIAAQGFKEDDLFQIIVPQLNKMGITCKIKKRKNGCSIDIYAESYRRFYEVIGARSPVPCYDYKFDIVIEKFPELLKGKWQSRSVEESFHHYRHFGFPLIRMEPDERLKNFTALKNADSFSIVTDGNILKNNKIGLKLVNYYHPQRFNMRSSGSKKSAIDVFNNYEILNKILSQQLETHGEINDTDIRNRCSLWANGSPYNFKPLVSKYIVEKYSQPGDTYLDPCAGFGGRFLGCMSTKNRFYIGVEPEKIAVEQYHRMANDLNFTNYHIYNNCYEDFNYDLNREVNLIFTSPPYYNKEIYNQNNQLQSNVRYKSYDEWKSGFLNSLIRKSYKILKTGGYFAIAIDDIPGYPLSQDFLEMAKLIWTLEETYKIQYNKNPFQKNNLENTESLFVFSKK